MRWIYMSLGDSWIRAQTQVTSSHMTLRHPDTAMMKVWCFTVRGRGYIPNLPCSFVFVCFHLFAAMIDSGSQAWWFARPQMAHVSGSRWKLGLEYCSDITSMLLCTLRYEMFFHAQAKFVYVFSSNIKNQGEKKNLPFLCNLEGG